MDSEPHLTSAPMLVECPMLVERPVLVERLPVVVHRRSLGSPCCFAGGGAPPRREWKFPGHTAAGSSP